MRASRSGFVPSIKNVGMSGWIGTPPPASWISCSRKPRLSLRRDFFAHLTVEKLLRKALRGDIALPIVRIERSQKAQRGVHLADLADYIEKRRAAAIRECRQLTGQR